MRLSPSPSYLSPSLFDLELSPSDLSLSLSDLSLSISLSHQNMPWHSPPSDPHYGAPIPATELFSTRRSFDPRHGAPIIHQIPLMPFLHPLLKITISLSLYLSLSLSLKFFLSSSYCERLGFLNGLSFGTIPISFYIWFFFFFFFWEVKSVVVVVVIVEWSRGQ